MSSVTSEWDRRPGLGGRVAMVTGGGRGLGLAVARRLAAEGADVVLLDLLDDVVGTARELGHTSGRKSTGVRCDVADEAQVSAAFDEVTAEGATPDILVNAAGVALGTPAVETSADAWRRVLDVNLTGTFLVCREFARRLIAAGDPGAVVNVSSMSGHVVNVPQTQAAYNVSKAGVSMLTKSLAIELLPHGIRVNAISPGYFASDMTKDFIARNPGMRDEWVARIPAGRMGEPYELGGLVAYLVGDESIYLIGQDILVDGGYTLV